MNKWIVWAVVVGVVVGCAWWGGLFGQDNYGYVEESEPMVRQNGDANGDFQICMDDAIVVIYHLWRDGRELPCRNAADIDRNGSINLNDVVLSLRHVFNGAEINTCPVTCDSDVWDDYRTD